jgi:hypothetical protein
MKQKLDVEEMGIISSLSNSEDANWILDLLLK